MSISKAGIRCGVAIAALFVLAASASAQRQMEKLGRGVVVVNQGGGKVFVSWRMLGTEPDSIAFNVYSRHGRRASRSSSTPSRSPSAPATRTAASI